MKRVLFFRVFLPCALLSMCLAGCRRDGIDGPGSDIGFVLVCSDDLLDFATPIAKFKDERDIEQLVVLPVDSFTKATVDNSSYYNLVYGSKLRYWQKCMRISGASVSRDMEVSYQLRDNAPKIQQEMTYLMYHTLQSVSVTSHPDESGEYVFEPLMMSLDISLGRENLVKGINLEVYLDSLMKNPDYKEEVTGK